MKKAKDYKQEFDAFKAELVKQIKELTKVFIRKYEIFAIDFEEYDCEIFWKSCECDDQTSYFITSVDGEKAIISESGGFGEEVDHVAFEHLDVEYLLDILKRIESLYAMHKGEIQLTDEQRAVYPNWI